MADDILTGRNSVVEALNADRAINKIYLQEGKPEAGIKEVLRLAKEKSVPVDFVSLGKLKELADNAHQGIVALTAPVKYYEIEEVMAMAAEKGEQPFLVLLDELQDPHNVGAILRTAAAAGVHGVLLPKKRTCQITSAVFRASAGAAVYMPVVRIGNITQTLENLKKKGFWVAGADMKGEDFRRQEDFSYPLVLVIGSEGKGMSRLVKETCDMLLNIPMPGKGESLNASVAAALLIYEVLRKRESR